MPEIFSVPICQKTLIFATPERIYDTITTGAGWNAFFTFDSEVDPRPGGRMVFRWKDWGPQNFTVNAECKVHRAERPGLFAFEWYPVGRENPTTITFVMEPHPEGTVVTVTEEGYPDTKDARAMMMECATGWGEAITLLKFYLEHGVTYNQARKK